MAKMSVVIIGNATSAKAALAEVAAAAETMDAKVQTAGSHFAAAGAKMSSVGKSMTSHVTLPVAAIGGVALYSAVKFQNAMELIHTQAGVAQSSIEGLSKGVLALAGPTATAPDELAAGLYHLTSQGLRGAQALDALRVAAMGAKMGQANLEDVTNALGAVIASKIGGVHSYSQAMGEMNAIVGSGDMRMQDLADAMGTGLPAKAKVAGVALKEIGGALAVFGDNNIRGAAAGTLLNSTLRLMEGPSTAAAKAMAELNINSLQLGSTLRNQGLIAAVEMLKEKLGGLSKTSQFAALTHMFGGRQAGGIMILMDQLGRLQKKTREVDMGGLQFAKDWQAYTQTTAYKMSQMGASMQAAGVTIGTILLPYVSRLVNFISGLVQKFDRLSPTTKKVIIVMAGVAAVIGPVISLVGALSTAIAFLVDNPITLLVAGVAALAGAMALAVLKPAMLQGALEHLGLSAKTSATVVRDLRTAFYDLKAAVEYVTADLEAIWDKWGTTITKVAQTAWILLKQEFQNGFEVIKGVFDLITGILTGNWSKMWKGIEEITVGSLKQIWDTTTGYVTIMGAVADRIGQAMWSGLKTGAQPVINWIISQLNSIINAYNAVAGWATGNIGAIGKTGSHGGKIRHAHSPGRVGPGGYNGPTGGKHHMVIHNHVHLDGKEVHKSVRKHDLRSQNRGSRTLRDKDLYRAALADG